MFIPANLSLVVTETDRQEMGKIQGLFIVIQALEPLSNRQP